MPPDNVSILNQAGAAEARDFFSSLLGLEAAGRAANVALLLDSAPADLRSSILRAADW